MVASAGLRARIAFDKRLTVDDGFGNEESSFEEQFVVWARVAPAAGREQVLASRLQGIQPVEITVWDASQTRQIGTDWRARDVKSGVTYAITAPPMKPDATKRDLVISATSGVAA